MEDTKWHPTADKINVSLFPDLRRFVLAVNPALEGLLQIGRIEWLHQRTVHARIHGFLVYLR